MSKKNLLLLSGLVLLVAAGIISYFALRSKSSTGLSTGRNLTLPTTTTKEEKEEVKADVLYEDTAGFSFRHPKDIKVTDVTPTEDEYYTELNLVKGSDKVVIVAKDTSSANSDEWIKGDTTYTGASLVGATTLGGISAKQYSKNGTLLTVAVDAGVVYLILGPKDGDYWEEVQSAAISSFKFASTSTSSGGVSTSSDIEYEAEEVIE